MSNTTIRDTAIENIRKAASPNSQDNVANYVKIMGRMTKNHMPLYGESDEEKDLVLHHLHKKFLKVRSMEDVINLDGKNLLYFSVFYDEAYVELLYMSLKSIAANTPNINFDVLFITDKATKEKIETFDIISKFNVDYLLFAPVETGPLASIRKLNIFDYKKISQYSKILFFDADIMCIRDLNTIFDRVLEPEKLYISFTAVHKSPLLLGPTHGIMYLTKDDAAFLHDNPDVYPFNAGQFLFLNSERMRLHFDNIRWLREAWPSEYFYEQSFMNYYFVLKSMTAPLTIKVKNALKQEIDEQLISVTYNPRGRSTDTITEIENLVRASKRIHNKSVMTVTGATKSNFSKTAMHKYSQMPEGILTELMPMHGDNTIAIHFAATLADGIDKKTFIKHYTDAYKLHI